MPIGIGRAADSPDSIGIAGASLRAKFDGSLIDLVPVDHPLGRAGSAAPEEEGRNFDHFCLRIRDFDEARLRAHLEAHGVEPGDVGTRYVPSVYLRDPDGNTVELEGPPDPAA